MHDLVKYTLIIVRVIASIIALPFLVLRVVPKVFKSLLGALDQAEQEEGV